MKDMLVKERNVKFVYLWSLEDDYGVYASFETIHNATGGVVNDTHFSFNGHFNFAHFIYKLIGDNKSML
jgi:hypothetical protein